MLKWRHSKLYFLVSQRFSSQDIPFAYARFYCVDGELCDINTFWTKPIHTTVKMVFSRYVEVGRIVLINYGPDAGKLATIIDIVDQNKCLIDGPTEITGVVRQVISYTRIALTDLKVNIQRNARAKTLKAAWAEADIQNKWDGSSWAKKLATKKKRASLSDFDRFKVMVAKKQKSSIISKKMKELKA